MGQEPKKVESTGMGNTILGDVNHAPPVVIAGQQSNNLWPIAALALATSLPIGIAGAGAAAYLVGRNAAPKPQPTQPQEFSDESVSIGLGRLEDFVDE